MPIERMVKIVKNRNFVIVKARVEIECRRSLFIFNIHNGHLAIQRNVMVYLLSPLFSDIICDKMELFIISSLVRKFNPDTVANKIS